MQVGTLDDSEELSRFREQWKQELRLRKQVPVPRDDHITGDDLNLGSGRGPQPNHVPPLSHPNSKGADMAIRGSKPLSELNADTTAPAHPKPRTRSSTTAPIEFGPKLRAAVEIYRKAAACEQRSDLDEALRLYMKAFRMDSNVDRAFHLLEVQQQAKPHHSKKHSKGKAGGKEVDAVVSPNNITPSLKLPESHGVVTGTLVSIISTWPQGLTFEAEDEREGVAISTLPDELLVHILRYLDITSLERFGIINRKSRIVSLDSSLWRDHVQKTYKPPQISPDEDFETESVETYMGDFRRVFIEHPRIRLDGVYIAICHYIRKGLSDNAWVQVNQLITYHRYLRFYPDGSVLSLLANEGRKPQQVITLLKPTLREKGFYIGTWYLSGSTLHITNLTDSTGSITRYTFQMILELRSRPLGRWNRLDFRAYDSVEAASGECTPVALKHDRPFWFSKVRSFEE